jgi:hypothetical protein
VDVLGTFYPNGQTNPMSDNKRRLKVVQAETQSNRVMPETTCFAVHASAEVDCQRQRCPHWIPYSDGHNCVHIATQKIGAHTLQHIGQIYGLTRMRICQIEKDIFKKIRQAS